MKRNNSSNFGSFFDDSMHGAKAAFTHKGAHKLPDGTLRDTKAAKPVSIDHDRSAVIGFLPPNAIYAQVVEYGMEKALMPWWKVFLLANLGGVYLSFGGAWAYTVGGRMPQLQSTNPGAQLLLFGLFGLPMGLALIVICGADLVTTNFANMGAAFFEGRANLLQVLRVWFFSYFGNLCGCLLVVWLLNETYLYDERPDQAYMYYLSAKKTGESWPQEILRAIFCNYLVCLGMWQATAAQDIIGKIFGILFPISAFVTMTFSHTVANMFWVPFAMINGAPISVAKFIRVSMIPDFIGNMIAGTFFLAGSYALLYGTLPGRIYAKYLQYGGPHLHKVNDEGHRVNRAGQPGADDPDENSQTAHGIKHKDMDGARYADADGHENGDARRKSNLDPNAV